MTLNALWFANRAVFWLHGKWQ